MFNVKHLSTKPTSYPHFVSCETHPSLSAYVKNCVSEKTYFLIWDLMFHMKHLLRQSFRYFYDGIDEMGEPTFSIG